MQSASNGAYISKKYMQAYEAKRSKMQAKKASKAQSQLQIAGPNQPDEKESAQSKPLSLIQEIGESKDKARMDSDSDSGSDYDKNNRSCEEVHSDELEGDLNLSDCEDNSRVQSFRARKKMAKASYKQAPARIFRQEIDTNVFKIEFKTLADQAELASGDPTICQKCKAIFNIHSQVEEEKNDDSDQVWICEFCNHKNSVDIEDEEKPKSKAINFLLEAAAQVQDKKAGGAQDISVVFCVDQSGSMCVSQEIKGKHKLKGDKTSSLQEFMKFSDGSDQRLQGERNITYVSRMQCLQAAIDQQILDMSNGAHNRKLGVVSFNSEVTVYGDGGQDSMTIAGDKLYDQEFLLANGAKQGQERMKLTVKDSAKELQKKIMEMEETGPTALGPAVATSIAMAAASGVQGSQVVICTDGLANVGLGSFDEAVTDDDFAAIEKFYTTLGEFAKEKGITINIISIIGDDCNLDALSKLAEMTNGEVERVNPVDLTNNFANILSQPILASNVVAKVKLHKGMTFRNEDPEKLSEDLSLMTREIGNVTADTEITFEYTMKKISELVKMEDFDLTKVKELPFQVQITYKALDGSKCIRVITEKKKISDEREKLEKQADFNILGQNAIQQSANIGRSGNVRFAQANAKQWKRKMGQIAMNNNNVQQQQAHGQYMSKFNNVYSNMQVQEDFIQKSSAPSMSMPMMGSAMPRQGAMPQAMMGSAMPRQGAMPQQNQKQMQVSKAKKAAPKKRGMMMKGAANSFSDESDAEDNANAFGAGFNLHNNDKKQAKKKQEKKGGFLGGLFGSFKKEEAVKEQKNQLDADMLYDEEEAEDYGSGDNQMMMQQMQAMPSQEVAVVESGAYAKKGATNKSKRVQQNDQLANELFKAAKSKF